MGGLQLVAAVFGARELLAHCQPEHGHMHAAGKEARPRHSMPRCALPALSTNELTKNFFFFFAALSATPARAS